MRGQGWAAIALLTAMVMGFSTLPAEAEDYPSRTVRIVVPLVAGTGMDAVTRIYADQLAKALGQPVVVENQPGATLTLALQNVAHAAPDGYTLVVSATLQISAPEVVVSRVNFDAARDFVPISLYLNSPFVLLVNAASGAPDLTAFVTAAKARSGNPLTYATSGTGSFPHLLMESLKRDLGFPASHVPYRNSGQIVADLVGGHVDAAMSETGAALGLVKEGKIGALGISSAARHPQMPAVPTMAEAAGRPGFEAVTWHVLLAPAATPQPIVDRLVAEMARITAAKAFQERISATGLMPLAPRSAPEMKAYLASERTRWSAFAKSLGLAAPAPQ